MHLEIFTIDGKVALQLGKNKSILSYMNTDRRMTNKDSINSLSAFRFRKKTIPNIVYLSIKKRKRLLELVNLDKLSLN